MRAPTVTALEDPDDPDGVAVSCMVEKENIADIMDRLEDAGATDILVLQIANSRTGPGAREKQKREETEGQTSSNER